MNRSTNTSELGAISLSHGAARPSHVHAETQRVMEEDPEQFHKSTGLTGSTGNETRPRPHHHHNVRKMKSHLSVSNAEDSKGCKPSPELFLETEATLANNIVKFFGLRGLTHLCTKHGIKSIERLSTGGVCIRGCFQAVDTVHGQVLRLLSKNKDNIAFDLAFSGSVSVARELKAVDDEVEVPRVQQTERHLSEVISSRLGQPEFANDDLDQGQRSVAATLTDSCNTQNVTTEEEADAGHPLYFYTTNLTVDFVAWEVASRTNPNVQRIAKELQVRISARKSTVPNKLILTLDGNNQQSCDLAYDHLIGITSDITKDLLQEQIPIGTDADVTWLQDVNWQNLKTISQLKNGSTLLLTELKKAFDIAVEKTQHRASVDTAKSIATRFTFVVKTGQYLVMKEGDIIYDNANVIVIDASSDLQHGTGLVKAAGGEAMATKCREVIEAIKSIPVGEAISVGPGKLSCQAVVYAITPGWRSPRRSFDMNDVVALKNAYQNSLKLAEEIRAVTVALPGLGLELSRVPKDVCARCMLDASDVFFTTRPHTTIKEVRFIHADKDTVLAFAAEARNRSLAMCEISSTPAGLPEASPVLAGEK